MLTGDTGPVSPVEITPCAQGARTAAAELVGTGAVPKLGRTETPLLRRMNSPQFEINADRKHDDQATRQWGRGKQRPANADRARFRDLLTDEDRSQN